MVKKSTHKPTTEALAAERRAHLLAIIQQHGPQTERGLAELIGRVHHDIYRPIMRLVDDGDLVRLKRRSGPFLFCTPAQASEMPAELVACMECGDVYPRTAKYWHKDTRVEDGLCTRCRNCHNAKRAAKARRQYHRQKRAIEELFEKSPPVPVSVKETSTGRVIKFGKGWRPHRDAPRRPDAMSGYSSALAWM